MALLDTNGDPDDIDYILPANDDAMRAIKLMVAAVADAVLAGRAMRKGEDANDDFESMAQVDLGRFGDSKEEDEDEGSDEQYLGQSTLDKIRSQRLTEDEADTDGDE